MFYAAWAWREQGREMNLARSHIARGSGPTNKMTPLFLASLLAFHDDCQGVGTGGHFKFEGSGIVGDSL